MELNWFFDAAFAGVALGGLATFGTPKQFLWARIALLGAFPLIALLMRSVGPIAPSNPAAIWAGFGLADIHTWPYIIGRGEELIFALAISYPVEWLARRVRVNG